VYLEEKRKFNATILYNESKGINEERCRRQRADKGSRPGEKKGGIDFHGNMRVEKAGFSPMGDKYGQGGPRVGN